MDAGRPVTLEEQIACVEREIGMRTRVYPRWVGLGKMTPAKSEWEIAAMEAVLNTLRGIQSESAQ